MPETEMIDCLLGERGSQTLHKLKALSCITMGWYQTTPRVF